MSLNPEPANPQERQEHHLPPKSYAAAAEEAAENYGKHVDEDSVKETPPRPPKRKGSIEPRPFGEILDGMETKSQPPSIPSTPVRANHPRGGLAKSYADAAEEGVNPERHATFDLHEGDEYSGQGLDASPKIPTKAARPHKRSSSKQSNILKPAGDDADGENSRPLIFKLSLDDPNGEKGSNSEPAAGSTNGSHENDDKPATEATNGSQNDKPKPVAEEANGEKVKPKPAAEGTNGEKNKPKPAAEEANGEKDNKSKPVAEDVNDDKENKTKPVAEGPNGEQKKLVYEKFESPDGKKQLTSVKPDDSYGDELAEAHEEDNQEKKSARDELVSGRRAGAGWENSAIRWAPLQIPLQRRLQTAMVLTHTLSIALFLTLFFLLCTIPLLWPLILPYLLYVLFSKAGTSGTLQYRSEWLRRLPIWSLFASYFPARLHRSQELPATRKYVFGYHPHGIISHGAFAAFATEALGFSQLFPGITNTLLTLDSNFRIPLYRDYALRLGLASVSRESCENILSKGGPNGEGMGRGITIVVGGARESLDAQPNSLRLVLARRKGFIKLAIRTGADIVPVLAFGENELYEQFDPTSHPAIHKFQLMVKKFMGFTVPLFHARGVFNYDVGMMPYRRPLNIVVGRPVMVQRQERPDNKYVDEIHEKYVAELKRVWDEWKDIFAKHRDGDLEIVE